MFSVVSLTSWGEGDSLWGKGASVAFILVGLRSSDGVAIKIPYGVDALLH